MMLIDEPTAERLYAAMGPATRASGGSAGNTIAGLGSLGAACQNEDLAYARKA